MKRTLTLGLVVAAIGLSVALAAWAAAPQEGSISGTARDVFDSALVGFDVRLRSLATGEVLRATRTDALGAFVFTGVEPGRYVLELNDPTLKLVATTGTLVLDLGRMMIDGVVMVPTGVVASRPAPLASSPPTGTTGRARLFSVGTSGGVLAALPGGGAGLFGASAGQVAFAASNAGIGAGIYGSVRSKNQ